MLFVQCVHCALRLIINLYLAQRFRFYIMCFPISSLFPGGGYLRARVIRATKDHLVVTFCGQYPLADVDYHDSHTEETSYWKSFLEDTRRKRSIDKSEERGRVLSQEEMHVWTAVLVKHNDISALKFVEYAAVLMKHGYDVTQGELVSFGKCPVAKPHGTSELL